MVVEHHPPPHLPSALQVAQCGAGLIGRARLNRYRRNLAAHQSQVTGQLAPMVDGVQQASLQEDVGWPLQQSAEIHDPYQLLAR